MTLTRRQQIEALQQDWATNPRWKNVKRTYTAEEVVDLRGSVIILLAILLMKKY